MPEVDDSELRCLECDYDLRGLTENRCPECGTPFDPEELREIAAWQPQSVPGGPTGDFFVDFIPIWWGVMWHPCDFARRFPARHRSEWAIEYSVACYALAAFAFAVTLAVRPWTPRFPLAVVIPVTLIGGLLASWLCETLIALLLKALFRPTRASRGYHFWRGLTHYTSGFLILTALWGGIMGPEVLDWPRSSTEFSTWGAVLAASIFLWWATTLGRMILARSAPAPKRELRCLLIPLVGIVAIVSGIMISYSLGLLLMF